MSKEDVLYTTFTLCVCLAAWCAVSIFVCVRSYYRFRQKHENNASAWVAYPVMVFLSPFISPLVIFSSYLKWLNIRQERRLDRLRQEILKNIDNWDQI